MTDTGAAWYKSRIIAIREVSPLERTFHKQVRFFSIRFDFIEILNKQKKPFMIFYVKFRFFNQVENIDREAMCRRSII